MTKQISTKKSLKNIDIKSNIVKIKSLTICAYHENYINQDQFEEIMLLIIQIEHMNLRLDFWFELKNAIIRMISKFDAFSFTDREFILDYLNEAIQYIEKNDFLETNKKLGAC